MLQVLWLADQEVPLFPREEGSLPAPGPGCGRASTTADTISGISSVVSDRVFCHFPAEEAWLLGCYLFRPVVLRGEGFLEVAVDCVTSLEVSFFLGVRGVGLCRRVLAIQKFALGISNACQLLTNQKRGITAHVRLF